MEERVVVMDGKIGALIDNISNVIVGKREVIELVVSAMLAGGHVLIEDVPGVGKTQLVSALASSCKGVFGRIQMTPDVMPTDITGFTMIDSQSKQTLFKKGATFCNFLLADEINRSSPKSQSALLETMEERQVSVDGYTYALPKPFMVLATQNSVETYGTYHLPEAQMDRFIMKISIGYPSKDEERDILVRNEMNVSPRALMPVVSCEDIASLIEAVKNVYCSEAVRDYILDIVKTTRETDYIKLGVSPRGSIALNRLAKAYAYVKGRDYVLPDDVKKLAPYVFAHRIMLTPKGKSMYVTNEQAIMALLENVAVVVR